ncbi:MAG: prolyl oligopeptidase family serine peptidase [Phenylobacterium sp.]|uniref:prolyl oligopeptidase family serine peptidase n=1 Tax=Phenylobacterium sp. TaxID=1871053 RepID=UPI002736D161|nr:prolyl oligopeptidase family serine peptidase [Phenylobacterium sp.]MDP3173099.1 prolyl oligopeptidase family serine peptidase [Phenylobacterium sp.]
MLLRTALTLLAAMTTLAAPAPDPDAYLEEIEGAPALAFARAENARSLPVLQNDPRYAGLHADALAIVTAKDRIPAVDFAGEAELRNFWQDAAHVRGVWRTTSLDSYRKAEPEWRTILDLDAVSAAEKANWVWKGANCLAPEERLCLVQLSDGGKDAVEVREFDTRTGAFVSGGFVSPQSKQDVAWIDADTLLIGRDWGADTLTESGYPFVLKSWKRGTPLSQARELFRGAKSDVAVQPAVLRDSEGRVQAVIAQRQVSFFEAEYHLLTDKGPVKLPFPLRSTLHGLVDGQLALTLEQDWPEQGFREGDLVAYDLAALKAAPATARGVLVLRPSESQAIEQVATTRGRLVVALYENVKGGIVSFAHGPGGWTSKALEMPRDVSVSIASTSERDDRLLVNVAGFLTPNTQRLADAASGAGEVLKTMPPRFDASKLQVDQHWATSKDGTRVPYFVVHRKDLKLDGTAPTLLYAYGGFQVSITPSYSGVTGKLWLERGGVYVVANIRGGGEFGPRWHNAGLKLNRQRVYDDFFAVSEDLIARKITSPRRLGIMGGSNGGLLMGVALTQRPELYNAIVIQVPLFDMIGYTHIGAGASWVGEYGDPAIPAERAVIDTYSPYQNLRAGKPYPEVYIETSTKDDRVHPAHARKAAARLKSLGYSYLYYENIDGGHAAAANLNETAKRVALEYTYLTRRLMD